MEIVKSHCNRCQRETNQDILHSETDTWEFIDEDDDYPVFFNGTDIYQTLKCRGCDTISFRREEWHDGNVDRSGNRIPEIHYYPPAAYRPEPKWLNQLDNLLEEEQKYIFDLMKEIYNNLHNNSCRLATMGIRALIEYIMIKKAGDRGSFAKNLDAFEAAGLISLSQEDILNAVLEAGHATIHRSYTPTAEDLHTCMDVTESIVASIFIHPDKANKLKEKIPPREK